MKQIHDGGYSLLMLPLGRTITAPFGLRCCCPFRGGLPGALPGGFDLRQQGIQKWGEPFGELAMARSRDVQGVDEILRREEVMQV